MNALSLSLNAKTIAGKIGFHPYCKSLNINHLSFADDLMVFMDGTEASLRETMGTLADFECMSGLRINPSKSTIYIGGNMQQTLGNLIHDLGIPRAELPVRYLGLPLTTRHLQRSDYEPLIDRIRKRLLSWTVKNLSYAGRLQLIKSVIRSITNFWSSVFRLPTRCIRAIDRLCAAYLWSGNPLVTTKSKVAWEDICTPQDEGGLGLRKMSDSSIVFSLSLLWRLIADHGSLWAAWTRQYLLRYSSFWDAQSTSRGSWIWRKLLRLKGTAKHFIQHEVNSGDKTYFWLDNWTSLGRLIDVLGETGIRRLGIMRKAKVAEVVSSDRWTFKRCRHALTSQIVQHIMDLPIPDTNAGQDKVLWRHGALDFKPSFSFKKTWIQISTRKPSVAWKNVIWFRQSIPRHAFISWLTVLDRLPTGERTSRWGQQQHCVLCGERRESRDHLFFACPYTFSIWQPLSKDLDRRTNPDWRITVSSLSRKWSNTRDHILLRLAFQATIYHVWTERNNRRYQKRHRQISELYKVISKEVHNRLLALPRETSSAMLTRWLDITSANIY